MVVEDGREHGILRVGTDDLEWLPGTIADWIRDSADANPPPPPPAALRSELLGRWHPVSSETLPPDALAFQPDRELRADGTAIGHWTQPFDMISERRWWCAEGDRLVIACDETWSAWHVAVDGPDALVWTGPEPERHVVRYVRSD